MSERPFMQLYVSDFIGDTLSLSTEQIGAYMLLLMAMWNAGGKLPADDGKLARVARMSVKKWKAISDDLLAFFEVDGDVIRHNRLTKELQKSESKSQSRASAGAEGGRAKALKDKEVRVANAMPVPQHLPDTITREEKREPTGSPKKGTRLPADWKLPGQWGRWALEQGYSEAAIRLEADKFRDFWISKGGKDAAKLDWEATWRNWMRNSRAAPVGSQAPPGKPSITDVLKKQVQEMQENERREDEEGDRDGEADGSWPPLLGFAGTAGRSC